nr:guanine nucleotide-binding protein G(I)/G(S)/G(O) subunit gamma-12 isoform X1 [Caretta caretta]
MGSLVLGRREAGGSAASPGEAARGEQQAEPRPLGRGAQRGRLPACLGRRRQTLGPVAGGRAPGPASPAASPARGQAEPAAGGGAGERSASSGRPQRLSPGRRGRRFTTLIKPEQAGTSGKTSCLG